MKTKSNQTSLKLAVCAALVLGSAPQVLADLIPFAQSNGGGIAVYFSGSETQGNVVAFKAQDSVDNLYGAPVRLDTTNYPGLGSFSTNFGDVGQYRFDLRKSSTPILSPLWGYNPTFSGSSPSPSGSVATDEPIDWAFNNYALGLGGPVVSGLRGGDGDGSSITFSMAPVSYNSGLNQYEVSIQGELVSDGFAYGYYGWKSSLSDAGISNVFKFSGTLVYDVGVNDPALVDFYHNTPGPVEHRINFYAQTLAVPDGTSTLLLIGAGLIGLACYRRGKSGQR